MQITLDDDVYAFLQEHIQAMRERQVDLSVEELANIAIRASNEMFSDCGLRYLQLQSEPEA